MLDTEFKFFDFFNKEDPDDLAESVLIELIDFSNSTSGAIFFLNTDTNKYERDYYYNEKDGNNQSVE